jgi:DNA-binding PadR family transcriptional regulator
MIREIIEDGKNGRAEKLRGFEVMATQFGQNGRGGFRAKRGLLEPTILAVLVEGDMHGYEIIATIEKKSEGLWKPSPGSVYPILEKATLKGLVKVSEDGDKKVYSLTSDGHKIADKAAKRLEEFWKRASKKAGSNRAKGAKMFQIIERLKDIENNGSDTQKEQAHQAVADFIDKLDAILGGNE